MGICYYLFSICLILYLVWVLYFYSLILSPFGMPYCINFTIGVQGGLEITFFRVLSQAWFLLTFEVNLISLACEIYSGWSCVKIFEKLIFDCSTSALVQYWMTSFWALFFLVFKLCMFWRSLNFNRFLIDTKVNTPMGLQLEPPYQWFW